MSKSGTASFAGKSEPVAAEIKLVQRASRSLLGLMTLATVALAATSPVSAYTDREIKKVFQTLDTNGDGKVTREEYSANKVTIIYRNAPMGATTLTFEETGLSRSFFDAADTDHDGTLSPLESIDALPFEAVDTDQKGYVTLEDLRRFMTRIGR